MSLVSMKAGDLFSLVGPYGFPTELSGRVILEPGAVIVLLEEPELWDGNPGPSVFRIKGLCVLGPREFFLRDLDVSLS